jgi:hypothetical protein
MTPSSCALCVLTQPFHSPHSPVSSSCHYVQLKACRALARVPQLCALTQSYGIVRAHSLLCALTTAIMRPLCALCAVSVSAHSPLQYCFWPSFTVPHARSPRSVAPSLRLVCCLHLSFAPCRLVILCTSDPPFSYQFHPLRASSPLYICRPHPPFLRPTLIKHLTRPPTFLLCPQSSCALHAPLRRTCAPSPPLVVSPFTHRLRHSHAACFLRAPSPPFTLLNTTRTSSRSSSTLTALYIPYIHSLIRTHVYYIIDR